MIRRYSFILGVFSLTLALGAHAQQQGGAQQMTECDKIFEGMKINKESLEKLKSAKDKDTIIVANGQGKQSETVTMPSEENPNQKDNRQDIQQKLQSANGELSLAVGTDLGRIELPIGEARTEKGTAKGQQTSANTNVGQAGSSSDAANQMMLSNTEQALGEAVSCGRMADAASKTFGACAKTAQDADSMLTKPKSYAEQCVNSAAKYADVPLVQQAKDLYETKKTQATDLSAELKKLNGDCSGKNGQAAADALVTSCKSVENYARSIFQQQKPEQQAKEDEKKDQPKSEQAKDDGKKDPEKSKEDKPQQNAENKPKEDTKNALANACTPGQKTKADGTPCDQQNVADSGCKDASGNPIPGVAAGIQCALAQKQNQQNQVAQGCGTGVSNITLPDGTQKACNGGTMNTAKTADNLQQGKSANNADARGVNGSTSGDSQQLASLPGDSSSAADGSQGASNARKLASDGKASYGSSGRSLFGGGLGLSSLSSGSGSSAKSVEGAKTDAAFFANAGSQEKCKQAKYKNTVGCRRQRQMLEEAKALGKKPAVQPASLDFKNFDN